MKFSRAEIKTLAFADYYFKEAKSDDLYLLLHGFNQSGQEFYEQIKESLPVEANILVPNAMFPMPRRKGQKYSIGFSWYFYDHFRDFYYMDQRVAVDFLKNLMLKLGLERYRLHIIGYSQGGYLAPFVAREWKQTVSVLGLACRFLDKELSPEDFPENVVQIQAHQDEFVDFARSKESFERLASVGLEAQYVELNESGHKIDDAYLEALSAVLQKK